MGDSPDVQQSARAGAKDAKSVKVAKKPDIFVVLRVLEALWNAGGTMRKTHLQNAVGLNFNIYDKYLELMTRKEYITTAGEERSKTVSITAKGLESYHRILDATRDFLDG